MRIAVLADPHSNLPALREVLKAVNEMKISKILIAGDLVGYGPYPKEVVGVVRKLDATVVKGNHDNDVLTRDYSWMNRYAARAAEWTSEMLDQESLSYLKSLKDDEIIESEGKSIELCHGSPEDPLEYVEHESRARELLERSKNDVIICGHTHVPMIVRESGKLFLNPGGIGQPRDENPDAAFAVMDTSTLKAEIIRIPYNVSLVQNRIIEVGLPEFLASRLSMGI